MRLNSTLTSVTVVIGQFLSLVYMLRGQKHKEGLVSNGNDLGVTVAFTTVVEKATKLSAFFCGVNAAKYFKDSQSRIADDVRGVLFSVDLLLFFQPTFNCIHHKSNQCGGVGRGGHMGRVGVGVSSRDGRGKKRTSCLVLCLRPIIKHQSIQTSWLKVHHHRQRFFFFK